MKIKSKCIETICEYIFSKIKDKEVIRELLDTTLAECGGYLSDPLLILLPRYCDATCKGLENSSALFAERFKKSFREIIKDFWQKCDSIPFIPYPDSPLWKKALAEGIAPFKTADGKCFIWRKNAEILVSSTPYLTFSEGKSVYDDPELKTLLTKLFVDEKTAEMFIFDCEKESSFDEVVRIVREKIEFYKEKTREELEAMSDTEVFDFFGETFGKNYFRYFDLSGNEITPEYLDIYLKFFVIFRESDYNLFYPDYPEDDDIPEECLKMIDKEIEDEICS